MFSSRESGSSFVSQLFWKQKMPTLILQIADYIPDFGDVTDGLICINISARQHTAHETYYQLCHLQFSLFFLHPASCFLLCNTQCSLTEADSDYFCFLSCSVHNNVWLLLGDIISTCQFRVTCWPIPSSCIILLPPPPPSTPNIMPRAFRGYQLECCHQQPQARQLLINWLCEYLSTSPLSLPI